MEYKFKYKEEITMNEQILETTNLVEEVTPEVTEVKGGNKGLAVFITLTALTVVGGVVYKIVKKRKAKKLSETEVVSEAAEVVEEN